MSRYGGALLGLVVLICGAHLLWAMRDHTSPTWDQGLYLGSAFKMRYGLLHQGPIGFVRAVLRDNYGRAPLYTALVSLVMVVEGPTARSGLYLNVGLWVVLLLVVAQTSRLLFKQERIALLAVVITGISPTLIASSNTQTQDFLLATVSILSFWALLRAGYFTRRWYSVLLGVMLALGTLTKLQFLTALLIPLVVIAIISLRGTRPRGVLTDETAGRNRTPTVVNIGLAAVTAVGLPLLWYVPNWGPVWSYMQATFFNSPSVTIADPYQVKVLLSFLLNYFDTGNGLEIVLLGALAGGIVVAEHHGHLRRMVRALNDVPAFFALCAFAVVPFLTVAFSNNQEVRYAIAGMVGAAILVAAAIGSIRAFVPRCLFCIVIVFYGITGLAGTLVAGFHVPAVPATFDVSTPWGAAYIENDGSGVVPDKVDYTLQLFRDLMGMTVLSGRTPFDVPVGILQDGSRVNPNTLYFYSLTNDTSYTFTTLVDLSPDQLRDLPAVLSPYVILLSRPLLAGGAVQGAGGTEGDNTSAESRLETKDLAGYTLVGRISGGNDAYQSRWLYFYAKTDSPMIRHSFKVPGGDRN
jgi:hypothetical protein